MESTKMEVENRSPTFGSSLLNDNFGRRHSEDDLDPLQLKPATEDSRMQDSTKNNRSSMEESGQSTSGRQSLDSLMRQNPNGATQMFTDMHGIPGALEEGEPLDRPGGRSGIRHMANTTAGGQTAGVTDWGAGTDGGRSGKPQVGVPYGSFAGV